MNQTLSPLAHLNVLTTNPQALGANRMHHPATATKKKTATTINRIAITTEKKPPANSTESDHISCQYGVSGFVPAAGNEDHSSSGTKREGSKGSSLVNVMLIEQKNREGGNGVKEKSKLKLDVDLHHSVEASSLQSRPRLNNERLSSPSLGLCLLPHRGHVVRAMSWSSRHRPSFVSGRPTRGRAWTTHEKESDMYARWKCADGAIVSARLRPVKKDRLKSYWIELTQEDCALLEKIRKPDQTHMQAFRELLRRVA